MAIRLTTPKTVLNTTSGSGQNISTEAVLEELNVTENGIYTPEEGVDGYNRVTVDVEETPAQTKTAEFRDNGEYSIYPDDGYVMDRATVTVNVRPSLQEKTITPTTSEQTITPDSGKDGLSSVTVEAVTAEIDPNITPEVILSGFTILGVTGTCDPNEAYQSGWREGREDYTSNMTTLTATENGEYSEGNGYTSVTVNVQPTLQTKTVAPTTSAQTVSPDNGYDGLSSVSVEAVTSAIDSNITAENIVSGVTILGVEGTASTGGGGSLPQGTKFGKSTFTSLGSIADDTTFWSGVTDMSSMFWSCRSLTTVPALPVTAGAVTSTDNAFSGCSHLQSVELFDTSNVTDMSYMFQTSTSLTTIPQFDTGNVIYMSSMFSGCESLTTIPELNTSNVDDMSAMFSQCTSLTTIPQLDMSRVTNVSGMFNGCTSLTTLPKLNWSSVNTRYANDAFSGCSALTDVGGFTGYKDNLNLGDCVNLTYQSLQNIIEELATLSEPGTNVMQLPEAVAALLTEEEGRTLYNKGWNIQTI